jgi:hypothetical protein
LRFAHDFISIAQSCEPLGVWCVLDETPVEIRTTVIPPDRPTFSQSKFCIIHSPSSLSQCIMIAFCIPHRAAG